MIFAHQFALMFLHIIANQHNYYFLTDLVYDLQLWVRSYHATNVQHRLQWRGKT